MLITFRTLVQRAELFPRRFVADFALRVQNNSPWRATRAARSASSITHDNNLVAEIRRRSWVEEPGGESAHSALQICSSLTNEASRQKGDKRAQIEEQGAKRRKLEENGEKNDGKPSLLPAPYSEEDIAQEERKPKHKVAVLIGYSGTGYRGMQMWVPSTSTEIEGYTNASL